MTAARRGARQAKKKKPKKEYAWKVQLDDDRPRRQRKVRAPPTRLACGVPAAAVRTRRLLLLQHMLLLLWLGADG